MHLMSELTSGDSSLSGHHRACRRIDRRIIFAGRTKRYTCMYIHGISPYFTVFADRNDRNSLDRRGKSDVDSASHIVLVLYSLLSARCYISACMYVQPRRNSGSALFVTEEPITIARDILKKRIVQSISCARGQAIRDVRMSASISTGAKAS